jgi:hypothetical protein
MMTSSALNSNGALGWGNQARRDIAGERENRGTPGRQ